MSELDNNLQKIEKLLAPLRKETLPHFINGKRDAGRSGKTFEGYTPVDNSIIGSVAAGNADDEILALARLNPGNRQLFS